MPKKSSIALQNTAKYAYFAENPNLADSICAEVIESDKRVAKQVRLLYCTKSTPPWAP